MPKPSPTSPRRFPFTLRITAEERRALMLASRQRRTSKADILRDGLDPLFNRLVRSLSAAN